MKPRIVFSDFDGTLTDHTEFSAKFLYIIDLLDEYKIPFIIVTGRSLSWAHFFLTHFEKLEYVISEGGGVISRRNERGLIVDDYQVSGQEIEWLEKFSNELIKRFPRLSLTADSLGRKTDRAIELCDLEDEETVIQIQDLMKQQNINFSTSNVHLNFWSGDISKYEAVKNLMAQYYPEVSIEETMFFGDSLNDQSMFRNVEHSVGVSNIEEVIEQMEFKPNIILKGPHNRGPNGVFHYLETLLK